MRKTVYLISGLLSVMVVCIPASTSLSHGPAPSPRDIEWVRRAYTILSTLNRLDRYETMYSSTESHDSAERADFVSFGLTPLTSGSISEILNDRLYDLVTPRSGDVLN